MTWTQRLQERRERERDARNDAREDAKNRRIRSMLDAMKLAPRLHHGVIENCSEMGQARPKEPEPVRDESYRRWVASLPCFECGIEGYSQAAHPNVGKARGKKLSDLLCFPMCCDRPGVMGCHSRFDQFLIVGGRQMRAYEQRALAWTRAQQGAKA